MQLCRNGATELASKTDSLCMQWLLNLARHRTQHVDGILTDRAGAVLQSLRQIVE